MDGHPPPPAALSAEAPAAPIAIGADWVLSDDADGAVLRLADAAPVPIDGLSWRTTARGSRLVGETPGGPVTIEAEFARCTVPASDAAYSYRAVLTLPDGRTLTGCLVGTGRAYPGRRIADPIR